MHMLYLIKEFHGILNYTRSVDYIIHKMTESKQGIDASTICQIYS